MPDFSQLFKIGQQMNQLTTELTNKTVTSTTGGGMVTVTADGRGQIKSVKIDPSVIDPTDIEMLEDLILAAVNDVQKRAEAVAQEEMKKLTSGLNLPFNLPGM